MAQDWAVLDDAAADRAGHGGAEDNRPDEVGCGRESDGHVGLERASRHGCRDGVRGVMEAVDVVEEESQYEDGYQSQSGAL